jgi:hypothetical protein
LGYALRRFETQPGIPSNKKTEKSGPANQISYTPPSFGTQLDTPSNKLPEKPKLADQLNSALFFGTQPDMPINKMAENRKLKVFLCHSKDDKSKVFELYSRLIGDNFDAWLDKVKLLPGQTWELEIRKAVREADVVVVCLSKQFHQAGYKQKEVRLALDTAMEKPEGEIYIIPARLEECDTLESLRQWHWVDLFEDTGYESLKASLMFRAKSVGI